MSSTDLDPGGSSSSSGSTDTGLTADDYIEVNGTSITVQWIGLLSSVVGGFILSWFVGLMSVIEGIGEFANRILESVTTRLVRLIDAMLGADGAMEAAWASAREAVAASGILAFVVGVAVAGSVWLTYSLGVSVLVNN